jgi:hypothetical protein
MTRKRRLIVDGILAAIFVFSFVCFLLRINGALTSTSYSNSEISSQLDDDDFDISLLRLNTIEKVIAYCDSLYATNKLSLNYPDIVAEVMRKKFYHGYSYYSSKNNSVGVFFEPIVKNSATAIVIPDDIVKYPNAACSQQSIVGMEVFTQKGYQVRKVSMYDEIGKTGHFAYEVFYENSWHFFDTNQEPDPAVLKKYKRPSVAFLAKHPEIVLEAYHRKKDPELFKRLVLSYTVGPINQFSAPNAYLYQQVTKFLTNFGWAIAWVLILLRSLKRRRQKRAEALVAVQQTEEGYQSALSNS